MEVLRPASALVEPSFYGGLSYRGTGKVQEFTAVAEPGSYGNAAGYATLQQALDDLSNVTAGELLPAAGVFELSGRFYGRRMCSTVKCDSGNLYHEPWKLEAHPRDRDLFDGTARGAAARVDALKAVVDGALRIDLNHLAVVADWPTMSAGHGRPPGLST